MWTSQRIKKLKDGAFKDYMFVVVSAAEPYYHSYSRDGIEVRHVANGIITGIEPILKVTNGLCIAHGRGTADKEVVDANDKIRMPPRAEKYTVRLLWISKKDFQQWYDGFSTEMLYAMSHSVFERPVFRETDWNGYEKINSQYANAVLEEVGEKKAVVWIQDIQFTLVPSILRKKRPDLLIAHFWHIPWPIADIFNICPWKKQILEGMLGNSLLGFHTTTDCTNFLESVSRILEAKVDFNARTVTYNDHVTYVEAFPLGVDYQNIRQYSKRSKKFGKSYISKNYINSQYEFLAFASERLNYIKGITERFQAIDRFLEKYPEYQGRFTSLNVLVPSRTIVPKNEQYASEVETLADVINYKYSTSRWQPINIVRESLPQSQVYSLYKSADMFMVTSLADGMNLAAKEYVAGGPDDGVLILSNRTGASHELSSAVTVNPYDIEQLADSIKFAIEMPEEEKVDRMKKMREIAANQNVYRWAGKFLQRLADINKNSTTGSNTV